MTTVLEFPSFPQIKVYGVLFTHVSNAEDIKKGILSLDDRYDFQFINSANIVSLSQLKAAVFKTLVNYHFREKKLRTNSVNSEVLFNLSPNANISDSLNRFGVSKSSENLIVLKITGLEENSSVNMDVLDDVISGKRQELSDTNLAKYADLKTIKKNYKLGPAMTTDSKNLGDLLVGIIQMADF